MLLISLFTENKKMLISAWHILFANDLWSCSSTALCLLAAYNLHRLIQFRNHSCTAQFCTMIFNQMSMNAWYGNSGIYKPIIRNLFYQVRWEFEMLLWVFRFWFLMKRTLLKLTVTSDMYCLGRKWYLFPIHFDYTP